MRHDNRRGRVVRGRCKMAASPSPGQQSTPSQYKLIAECTRADFDRVRGQAMCFAGKKGRSELAEDFASFVVRVMFGQEYLRYNFLWLWSKFLRLEFGDKFTIKGQARALAGMRTVSLDVDAGGYVLQTPDTAASHPDEKLSWQDVLRPFRGIERVCLVLKYQWDFTDREIAECTGHSRQCIHAVLKGVKERLARKVGKGESNTNQPSP